MSKRIVCVLTLAWFLPYLELRAQDSQPSETPVLEPTPVVEPEAEKRSDVQDAIYSLDETVVIAQLMEKSIFDTPATVSRVSQRDVAVRRAVGSLPEALRDVPGVHVQKTSPGQGSPFIRGFTGFRTVLLIDGIRLNNSVFRDGPNQYWTTIDALSLDRVELVKGPSSVLYGSDAAGGTLGTYTERVRLGEEGQGWDVGGRAYYRFSTAEASHSERVNFNAGYDGKFGIVVGETLRHFGDLDGGGDIGRQSQTSYDFRAVDVKWRARATENVEVEFLFQSIRLGDVPRTHSTADAVTYHGTVAGNDIKRDLDQDRDLALATVILTDGAFFEEAQIKVGVHHQGENQDRVRSNGRNDRSKFDVDTFISAVQFETETIIGTLVYGADLYVDDVDSRNRTINTNGTSTTAIQGPVADDSTYTTAGVFIQDNIDITESSHLSIGARYTYIQADADVVQDPQTNTQISIDETYDSVVGGVSFLQEFTDEINGFAAVNLGFRAPNLSDLSRFDIARSGEIETPAPGLDPEHFLSFEIGPKLRFERFSADLTYFYTELFETIVRRPTGNMINGALEVTKANAGDGHIQGVEFWFDWNFWDDFGFFGSFSWIEGEADDFESSAPVTTREPISRIPPIYGRAGLRWDPVDVGFHAEFEVEIVGDQDRLSPSDIRDTQRIPPGGSPGYTTYNLRFSYDIEEDKTVFLNLENLSDKNYRVHGSGSNEAGFNAVVGFDVRF